MIYHLEKISAKYTNWKPTYLSYIKHLEWNEGDLNIIFLSPYEQYTTTHDAEMKFYEVAIKFSSASNIKLRLHGPIMHQVTGFNIIDLSQNGWERIYHEIEDYENGTIHFYCKDIVVLNVT